jgi:hypothetical protein
MMAAAAANAASLRQGKAMGGRGGS